MKNNYTLRYRLITIIFILFLGPATIAQSWQWAKSGGSFDDIQNNEEVLSMVTDAAGNVYVLASVGVPGLQVGGVPKTGIGSRDYMIASFTCSGQYRWSKIIGNGSDDHMQRLQIDGQGNIYAVGKVTRLSTVYFKGEAGDDLVLPYTNFSTDSNKQTLFMVKYSSAGVLQWLRMPQAADENYMDSHVGSYSHDVQVDVQGNSYWLCRIPPGVYADGAFVNTQQGRNFFIFKYNAAGQFLDAHAIDISLLPNGGYTIEMARNHNTGQYYIWGTIMGAPEVITIGGQVINNPAFLAAFNPNGTFAWKHLSSSGGFTICADMAIDKDNSIYITGGAWKNDTFAGATFVSEYLGTFPYIIKLTADGALVWSVNGQTVSSSSTAEAIAINGNEVAVTFGYGIIHWGGQTFAQADNEGYDVMLARVNKKNGALISLADIEGNFGYWDFGTAITADVYGNYYMGGRFDNFLYAPGQTLIDGAEGTDFFVAKYGTANCNCPLLEPDFSHNVGSNGADFSFDYTGTGYESISWNFGDGGTGLGENPQHTFTQSGNHDVCVTITNSCGSKQYCSQINATLRLDNREMTVQMYPNPVKDYLNVTVAEETSYDVFTILGAAIQNGTLRAGQGQISFNEISSGWYLVVFRDVTGRQKTVKLYRE